MIEQVGSIKKGRFTKENSIYDFDFNSFNDFFEKFNNSECLSLICCNKFYLTKEIPVFCLEPSEMKKFNTKSSKKYIYKKMIELLEDKYSEHYLCVALKAEEQENKYGKIEELLKKCINEHSLDDDLINELFELFYSINSNLLGVYHKEDDEYSKGIYICPDNIYDEVENHKKEIDFYTLINSVLVHEYTHYLHISTMIFYKLTSEKNRICRSGVLETVAESIQALYMFDIGYGMKWINNHSEGNGKMFPGWGYKGWSILCDYCENNNLVSEFDLLKMIIELSLTSWKEAYSFITTIEKLNTFKPKTKRKVGTLSL